ncbi:MAG TPA: hypothetical protein VD994_13445, partial [Prosthecobacter sp.]|nr:hypothetical protein [Prosthecobacter sp.]
TILGIFLLAFYFKRVGGTAAFAGAGAGEAVVLYCFFRTEIAYLWFNGPRIASDVTASSATL